MPFRARGSTVYKKKGDRWVKSSREKNASVAKRKASRLNILHKQGKVG